MRTSVRELSFSQAASALSTFAASVRISYRSKSKWMSLRASIVRNSLSGGRSATVAGRLPAAGVRASARLTATLPGGADNAADGARNAADGAGTAADGAGTAADATIGVFAQPAMEKVAISIVNEVLVTLTLRLRAGPPRAARLPTAASA